MKYYRVRDNNGTPIQHDMTIKKGTENLNGEFGITDRRFINDYGYYRRITGSTAKKILAKAKKETPDKVYCGGMAIKVDYNLYDVPVTVISSVDPQE